MENEEKYTPACTVHIAQVSNFAAFILSTILTKSHAGVSIISCSISIIQNNIAHARPRRLLPAQEAGGARSSGGLRRVSRIFPACMRAAVPPKV